MGGDLERALVGDLEPAHLLDRVAPQLDADGVLLRRREDVEDAAADRELAALLHEVDARVGDVDEPLDDGVEAALDVLALHELHRLEVAEAGHLRLQHAADGAHDDLQRAGGGVVGARVGEPAQHGEAAADGVGARAQPLVRQRLPARVERDLVGVEQAAERADQVLRLAAGGGDGEDGPAEAGQRRHDEGTQAGRAGEVEDRGGRGLEGARERGVGGDDVEQAGERGAGRCGSGQGGGRRQGTPDGGSAAGPRGADPGGCGRRDDASPGYVRRAERGLGSADPSRGAEGQPLPFPRRAPARPPRAW